MSNDVEAGLIALAKAVTGFRFGASTAFAEATYGICISASTAFAEATAVKHGASLKRKCRLNKQHFQKLSFS